LSITDQYLHFNISRFPHLETLQLFICNELERIKISAQGLKMLEMEQCRKLVEVEIDAPNLSSFQYSDIRNEFPMIFSKNAPCPFELSLLSLSHRIDTLWFLKLRELLVMSNQRKVLRLTIHCQEVCPPTQVYWFSPSFFFNVFLFCNFTFCLLKPFYLCGL
jgi:hypothetical protein